MGSFSISECECHDHTEKCHFDPAVYLASSNRTGGYKIPEKYSFIKNIYLYVYVPVISKTLECIKTFNTNFKDSS